MVALGVLVHRRTAARAGTALLLACSLMLIGVLALPAPGRAAGWAPAFTVSPAATQGSGTPAVAMNPRGDAVVAWAATLPGGLFAVRVVTRNAGGGFGAEQTVPAGGDAAAPTSIRVAVNERGDAVVTWVRSAVARVAMRPAGGGFGPEIALPNGAYQATASAVGIDETGTATVAIAEIRSQQDLSCNTAPSRYFNQLTVQSVTLAGTPGPRPSVYTNSDCLLNFPPSVTNPAIAIDPRGDGILAFQADGMRHGSRALAAGSFFALAPRPAANEASVAIDAAGRYMVAFKESNQVHELRGTAGGSSSAPTQLSDPAQTAALPAVGTSVGGTATVVWQATPDGTQRRVFARDVSATGTLGALSSLSGASSDATAPWMDPRVAVNGAGAALALWRVVEPATGRYALRGAARPAGGGFGSEAGVSGDPSQDSRDGSVGIDGQGGGIAAFQRFDGAVTRIFVAPYDVAPPALGSVDVPATAAAGTPVRFTAGATDDWGTPALRWDFGDGTGADGGDVTHTYAGTAGPRTVTVTATDGAGNTAGATRAISIAVPVPPGAARLALTRVSISRTRFAVGRGRTAVAAGVRRRVVPRGAIVRFTLSERATARLAFQRAAPGRRVGRRCLAPTRARRGRPRCTRWLAEGALTRRNRRVGANTVAFSGRIGLRPLTLGRHRVIVSAATVDRRRATATPRAFTIVRP
jgi:hypothetical protein